MKILVVEDDDSFAQMVRVTLETEHHEVATAANGRLALEYIDAARIEDKPDLIILDQMMPEMDGIEALKRLKANEATAHIPVLMLTAIDTDAEVLHAWKTGVNYYLTKPINPFDLVTCVKSLFED